MVHQVMLSIDGWHFGLAIYSDRWYQLQYASGGASSLSRSFGSSSMSGNTSNKVTIKNKSPTGTVLYIGDTEKGLQQLIKYAREECGFHKSDYGLFDNNCRKFCAKLAQFLGVIQGYKKATKGYFFAY